MTDAKIRILVLTNRDSDNVGDQIIEATVISLLKAAMANLGFPEDGFEISSRAASIISRKYMRTGDPELLVSARKAISQADVVVFGGAPLFNYRYQSFYLRTIKTLELAREYDVPVLFSSIGVEPFDPSNAKSVQLRDALISSGVRQITTRDDVESARRYVEGTDINVAHVSDPAVFADVVFGPSRLKAKAGEKKRKRIGLVVTRAGIFKDNGIPFTESDQRRFWLDVIETVKKKGYDYKLFTTGHFSDEVFLDALVREKNIPMSKAAITVNSPEELIDELAACDGIIAYRLHASITSFAYGIPSIGLTWNFKVPYFYESVGYGHRALSHDKWQGQTVVDALERAMAEGVAKDEAFLLSVYETLYSGLSGIFAPDGDRPAYTYEELRENLPPYGGTSLRQYREKVRRKLRRTYEYYKVPTAADKEQPKGLIARVRRRVKAML